MDKQFWKSKKIWVAVFCILFPALNAWLGLGLAVDELFASTGGGAAYLVGQGLADFAKHAKTARK